MAIDPLSYANLPNNTIAERAVLGACLIMPSCLNNVMEILTPKDFFDVNNSIAYEIMIDMFNSDKPIDLVTYLNEMTARGVYNRLGGQPFVAELMENIEAVATATYHAKIVKDHSLRRDLIMAGQRITTMAYQMDLSMPEIIAQSEKLFMDTSLSKGPDGPEQISDLTGDTLEYIRKIQSGEAKKDVFKTNFYDLDEIISLRPGTLNIIAGRPSMGKTALAMNIAQFGGDSNENKPVLVFSLEMSKQQLTARMLAAQAEVNLNKIMNGTAAEYDLYKLENASQALNDKKIFITEAAQLNTSEFRAKCRRFKAKNPDLGLIVVDYIQLMNGTGKSDNRQYEVAEITRVMKSVAVETNCAIIALSQLSREAERRTEKKPQLSDLRDSGAIEQDADSVILIFRQDYYDENDSRNQDVYKSQYSKTDLRIAKNRNGRTGICSLTFMREFTKFMSYAEEY